MSIPFTILAGIIFGALLFPLVIYLRSSRDTQWANPSISSFYKLVFSIVFQPSIFESLKYENGKKPFWYLVKDEITDVVNGRPDE